jgi:tetratricopeptide (TPR) repeat protein
VGRTLASASAFLQQSQFQATIDLLQPLSDPGCDPRVNLLLAGAFEGNGDVPKAAETLQRAHTVWPSNNSVAVSLARLLLASGKTDKAVEALGSFHVTPATPLQEMEEAVVVFIAGQRLESAQAVAATAYRSYPSTQTLLLLANALQLEGRYKDVNRLMQDKRAANANSPPFLITFAESEYDAMLYDAARSDLEKAISIDPNSYQAHFLLGNVLLKQGRTDQAVSEYRRATELAPNQPRAYYQLALIFRDKSDEASEEQLLSKALAADARYAPAHYEMGSILMSRNQLPDAVGQLSLAVQLNPNIEQAYFLLAKAYARLGEKDKSDAMVKRFEAVRAANRRNSAKLPEGQRGDVQATKQ